MKKILLVAVAIFSLSTAFAQGNINQGDWMVGGTTNFSSSKYGSNANSKATSFSFAPNIGYFFINQLAGGLRFDISSYKSGTGSTENKQSSFMLEPFLRYYFLPSTQKVNVFADAGYGFGSSKSTYGTTSQPSVSSSAFNAKAGVAVFVTPVAALEFALGYNSLKYKGAPDRYNSINFGIGFQIHLPGGGAVK